MKKVKYEREPNRPIRVLQMNSGSQIYSGVAAMIYEIYKNIDREKFQFDFVSPMKTTYEIKRKEIEEMGGNIIELDTKGNLLKRKTQLFIRLKRLIKERKYDIVHINSGVFFFNLQVAFIAKISGVKRIIIHSHNGTNPKIKIKNKIAKILKPLLQFMGTDYLTCSEEAAKNMFTKKLIRNNRVITILNGIETDKFKFNQEKRNEYRKELKIEDKIVLGHIGRFMRQKNHKFLLQIFNELLKIKSNAVLLLVGEGELREEIEKQAKELGIYEKIMFLGLRKDIPELLSCMDVFVLPSFYEGLPVVGVEAQASGLPLVLSDFITKEVKISENVEYISLSQDADKWAVEINNILDKQMHRDIAYKNVKEKGFDIKETAKKIEQIYLN